MAQIKKLLKTSRKRKFAGMKTIRSARIHRTVQ